MFGSFFSKKSKNKSQGGSTSQPVQVHGIDTYLPLLKKILSPMASTDKAHLLPAEQQFIKNILELSNSLNGVHAAYYFLNNYLIKTQLQQVEVSDAFSKLRPTLESLHQKMLEDPALNWYGVPRPSELQKSTQIYKGEMQYNQRMEYFLTSAAEKINQARQDFSPEDSAIARTFTTDFLQKYVAGKLDADEISLLDNAGAMMREKEIDFITVQTALQLYRYLIANKENSAENANFIASRSGLIPAAQEFKSLDLAEKLARIERYLPEGDIKDHYEASRGISPINKPSQAEFSMNMNQNMQRWLLVNDAFTPLQGHYTKYMDAILDNLKQESIQVTKKGALPFYTKEGGRLLETTFEKVQYPEPFIMRQAPGIWNSDLTWMVPELHDNEAYPGENLYKHLTRLYTISMLTPDPAVREEARTRMEWWYSNIMPYYRGSAAVAEGLSKLPLLVHNIRPTQMKGQILPDLGAICLYSEEEYIKHHDEFYANHLNQHGFALSEKKPLPSRPLPSADEMDSLQTQTKKRI